VLFSSSLLFDTNSSLPAHLNTNISKKAFFRPNVKKKKREEKKGKERYYEGLSVTCIKSQL
jgi:hypothetical protein